MKPVAPLSLALSCAALVPGSPPAGAQDPPPPPAAKAPAPGDPDPALKRALLPNQKKAGEPEGSWDPCDAWGSAGGRVYATAINAMALGICQRTPPAGPAKGR